MTDPRQPQPQPSTPATTTTDAQRHAYWAERQARLMEEDPGYAAWIHAGRPDGHFYRVWNQAGRPTGDALTSFREKYAAEQAASDAVESLAKIAAKPTPPTVTLTEADEQRLAFWKEREGRLRAEDPGLASTGKPLAR